MKLTPGKKAQRTAKWARIMTKWLVTYSRHMGAKWNLVDFCGKAKAEFRGTVDLLAIRKDNSKPSVAGLKRGDLFEIILIQSKGGSSPRPTAQDIARLHKVAKHYKAKTIDLAEWRRREMLDLFVLKGTRWSPTHPREVFG